MESNSLPKLTETRCFVLAKEIPSESSASDCYFNQSGYFEMNVRRWVRGLCCASEIVFFENVMTLNSLTDVICCLDRV